MGETNAARGTRNGRCRFPVWVAPLGLLLFGVGCASDRYRPPAATVDPLTGGAPVAAGGPSASAVPPPTPVSPTVPPIPVSVGAQSPAALASGAGPKPLDPTRDLRIATPVSNPSSGPPQATLLPSPPPVARGLAPAGTRVASFEQAQAFLTARGVKWQSLQTWGDQGAWKFSCSIPNPKNAYISRTYEAQARDSISAVQAVIDQIERDGSTGY